MSSSCNKIYGAVVHRPGSGQEGRHSVATVKTCSCCRPCILRVLLVDCNKDRAISRGVSEWLRTWLEFAYWMAAEMADRPFARLACRKPENNISLHAIWDIFQGGVAVIICHCIWLGFLLNDNDALALFQRNLRFGPSGRSAVDSR